MKTFYINGTIVTMEDSALYAEAAAVENGRILEVGSKEDVLKHYEESDEVVDLKGKTMFPGFIDGHSHFTGLAVGM